MTSRIPPFSTLFSPLPLFHTVTTPTEAVFLGLTDTPGLWRNSNFTDHNIMSPRNQDLARAFPTPATSWKLRCKINRMEEHYLYCCWILSSKIRSSARVVEQRVARETENQTTKFEYGAQTSPVRFTKSDNPTTKNINKMGQFVMDMVVLMAL
ncbi:hypothetical protein L195_g022417 [Trifolium pratense]|uniref:Uncharacterized protein n=1 Tax=Trifolium pratense TaxID=57577 RepID=A0A2K3N827_TRIPR|nr:hypothetical protein L195_g022417 [Trifolium pratense]